MNILRKRAPASLPRAERDLIAEGGNVLASDDAPVITPETAHPPARHRPLGKLGRWIARVFKS